MAGERGFGFVPEDLRQLLRFVPTRGWDAVTWRPLLGQLRKLSWQYATGRGVRSLARELDPLIPEVDLGGDAGEDLATVTEPRRLQVAGDAMLAFYFRQWRSPAGLFLDLRTPRWSLAGDRLEFRPSGLWVRLRPEFRTGMVALYQSFYRSDPAALDQALRQMGLLPDHLDDEAADELRALLDDHFGIEQRAQHFSIDAFKDSFDALFDFFLEHDYRVHSDFVFVGFYLITLYLALERGGQAHDVRTIATRSLG